MNIAVTNITAIQTITWYNAQDTRDKLSRLPLKIQWILRKNVKALEPVAQAFADFRDELVRKRNEEWFVEGNGKCENITQPDENGNEQEGLRILDEYMDEFKKYEDDMNKQLSEIADEENQIDVTRINIDDFVEAADDCGSGLTVEDLEFICLFEDISE